MKGNIKYHSIHSHHFIIVQGRFLNYDVNEYFDGLWWGDVDYHSIHSHHFIIVQEN